MRRLLNWADNLLLVAALAGGTWWGVDRYVLDDDRPPPPAVVGPAGPTEGEAKAEAASRALDALAVKGRAPRTGYDRKAFGVGAIDPDRNGCDYRNDVLRRDLTDLDVRRDPRPCVVLHGLLDDPYTGRTIAFDRATRPTPIEVDHVVALADAWQKGAQQWDQATRFAFGNDPRNLLAVARAANRAKGDGDAATWLPPNKAYRCEYVAKQIDVKAVYGLWVTQAEHDAMQRVLAACP